MLNWGGETEMSIPLNLSKLRTRQFSGAFLMLIAALAAGLTFNYRGSQPIDRSDSSCREIVREAATINSVQLAQLHNKIGETSDRIHQWLGSPHCILPKAAIRSGIITDREAYQLNNVSQVILAYESGQLIGFKRDPIQVTSSHKEIELKQTWELQTGDSIVGHDIVGGLGGLSIEIKQAIYAPADGIVYGHFAFISQGSLSKSQGNCLLFSSAQMPAYLLQLCGLSQRNLGVVSQGQPIGKTAGYLHVALLREDGQWVFVSPARELLKRLLRQH